MNIDKIAIISKHYIKHVIVISHAVTYKVRRPDRPDRSKQRLVRLADAIDLHSQPTRGGDIIGDSW